MKIAIVILLCAIDLFGASLKAGVAKVDITPAGPIWMSGYAARTHPSEGVLAPLWAKALALESSPAGRMVIVTADVAICSCADVILASRSLSPGPKISLENTESCRCGK